MATITEDYCSFEIAKLLKEKGFDEDCWCWYEEDGYFRESNDDFGFQSNSWHVVDDDEFNCSAPTIQMAIKWLREAHKIFIEISVSIDLNGTYHYRYFILNKECKYIRKGYTDFDWNYEQAVEEAIKYCLENLI